MASLRVSNNLKPWGKKKTYVRLLFNNTVCIYVSIGYRICACMLARLCLCTQECLSLRQHYEQVDRLLALNEFTALYPRLANTTLEGQRDSMQRFLCGDLPVNSAAFEFLNRRVFLGDKTQQGLCARLCVCVCTHTHVHICTHIRT